ncbi:MAG: gliding motility lipoprotein GldH [Chitinophagaceae bacterium]
MNASHSIRNLLIGCSLYLAACNSPIGVFEKDIAFKKQEWQGINKPSFNFTIADTAAAYNIYLVLRHTDAYGFNNIWMKVTRKGPDTTYTQQVDLRLATNGQGWLGTGMDDIWEHRIPITQGAARFRRSGAYEFTLEQVMRQDPLLHVLNAGIRIEKVN